MAHGRSTTKPEGCRNTGTIMTRLNFYIRTAKLSDADEISDIYQQINPHKYSITIIKKTIKFNLANIQSSAPVFFYVACCDSEILAFSVARYRSCEDAYEIECACKHTFRSRGLGHTLIKKLIKECTKKGFSRFIANVQPDNFICLSMLKKFGFKESNFDHSLNNLHSKLTLNL